MIEVSTSVIRAPFMPMVHADNDSIWLDLNHKVGQYETLPLLVLVLGTPT